MTSRTLSRSLSWSGSPSSSCSPAQSLHRAIAGAGFPAVDARVDEDGLTLIADVPGISLDALEITLENRRLTISASADLDQDEAHDLSWSVKERGGRSFERSFRLPFEADRDNAHAVLRDGVLTLTLPKAASARPARIRVEGGTGHAATAHVDHESSAE